MNSLQLQSDHCYVYRWRTELKIVGVRHLTKILAHQREGFFFFCVFLVCYLEFCWTLGQLNLLKAK